MWGADTDSSNRWNLVYDAEARCRRLAVPGIEAFEGNGVYYAATHQEALICGTGPVVVVGGGKAAGQATLFLASRGSRVHLVIRGDDLGKNMSRYSSTKSNGTHGCRCICTQIREVHGDDVLQTGLKTVVAEDVRTGKRH